MIEDTDKNDKLQKFKLKVKKATGQIDTPPVEITVNKTPTTKGNVVTDDPRLLAIYNAYKTDWQQGKTSAFDLRNLNTQLRREYTDEEIRKAIKLFKEKPPWLIGDVIAPEVETMGKADLADVASLIEELWFEVEEGSLSEEIFKQQIAILRKTFSKELLNAAIKRNGAILFHKIKDWILQQEIYEPPEIGDRVNFAFLNIDTPTVVTGAISDILSEAYEVKLKDKETFLTLPWQWFTEKVRLDNEELTWVIRYNPKTMFEKQNIEIQKNVS